jgi:hypothetical protein
MAEFNHPNADATVYAVDERFLEAPGEPKSGLRFAFCAL